MTYHSLRLAQILDVAGVIKVMDALCAVPGVDGVQLMSGESVVEVRYDHQRTSIPDLAARLARSGYPPELSCTPVGFDAQMVFE